MAKETFKFVLVLVIFLLSITYCESIASQNNTDCQYPTEHVNDKCICRPGFERKNCTSGQDICYCSNGDSCAYGNCSCGNKDAFSCTLLPPCGKTSNITCKHGGTCVLNETRQFCVCPDSVNMTDCTPNKCDLDKPCQDGKCIPRDNDDYDCICDDGSVGKSCGLNKKCTDGFCLHGGTCYEYEYARCRCMPGFHGPRCEENMTAQTCSQFGTQNRVINSANETECICRDTFKGKACDLLDCVVTNPCMNEGLCYSDSSSPQGFYCYCQKGWSNEYCRLDVDECLANPCGVNASCANLNGSYECLCPDNTTRSTCDDILPGCLQSEKCAMLANDGMCHADCNSRYCNFDGGDCITEDPWIKCTNLPKGYCRSLSVNGKCDQECNNENCLFDVTDCNNLTIDTCPLSCSHTWGDGECQPECNGPDCGYDGSDCPIERGPGINGTMVVTYFSAASDAFRTIGRISSAYSRAVLSFVGQTNPFVPIEWGGPSHLVLNEAPEIKYTAFFSVKNDINCSVCWSSTESLTNFIAALYINNTTLFTHNGTEITIQSVKACEPGFYGAHCDHPCPSTCNGTDCGMVDGTCTNGCITGHYGMMCENQCSPNCERGCGSGGNCTDGVCKSGYRGPTCIEECPVGKFGFQCSQNCNRNCDGGECNSVDGTCSRCIAGYKGDNCSAECEDGKYGVNCLYICGQCSKNDPCNHVNGTCVLGCKDGYDGTKCTDCIKGTYGEGCKMTCPNCKDKECNADGNCKLGCISGFSGSMCTKALKSNDDHGDSNSSTIIAVIIILVILIFIGVAVVCILWRRDQAGSYVLGETKQEDTAMKTLQMEEDMVKNNGETEPLVAVTPTDKNFHEAKLIIETDCAQEVNSSEQEASSSEQEANSSEQEANSSEQEANSSELDNKEEKRQSNATKSTRSSKGSEYRPESIHGNGPGGVYVGGSPPLDRSINSNRDSKESNKSSSSVDSDTDSSKSEDSESSPGKESDDGAQQGTKKSDEKVNENRNDPVTTTNESGLKNTDGL